MKAVVLRQPGSTAHFEYMDVPTPVIRPGWSLVKIKGFGINRSEIFTREGKSPSVRFPRILGIECVGVVHETSDAQRLPVGAKVVSIMGEMGRAFDGSYAEYCLLPNEQIYPIASDLPWRLLAAIPETYYTAYGSLQNLRIKETDTVLVRGATSGVGVAFAKLLKAVFPSIQVYGSSRSSEKRALLLAAGFDGMIEDREGILQTDHSFDKVLELIGPATIKNSFAHIREGGIICVTGLLGGVWELQQFDPIMEIKNNSYLTSFHSGEVSGDKLAEVIKLIEAKKVDVTPERIFALADVGKAHDYLQSADSFGKVIVLNE